MTQRIDEPHQSTPRVVFEDDMPLSPSKQGIPVMRPVEPIVKKPDPKRTYLELMEVARGHAQAAADAGFAACDWYAIFDRTTADKYRRAAKAMAEFEDHLQTLIEQATL